MSYHSELRHTWGYLVAALIVLAAVVVVLATLLVEARGPICWEPDYAPGTQQCVER